jgi:sugar/nucleoside kinase (ribokinase family)
VVCAGNAALDRTFALTGPARMATSNPAHLRAGFGGVARNVAENLARLGVTVALVTQVGDDLGGRALRDDCAARGIDVRHVMLSAVHPTSEYAAIIDPQSELVIGASATAAIDALTAGMLAAAFGEDAAWTFADCNLPAPVLAALIERSRAEHRRLAVDAVSIAKAARLPRDLRGIAVLFVNDDEARAMLGGAPGGSAADVAHGLRERGAGAVVLTRGARGAVVASAEGTVEIPAPRAVPVDVTGAGDALIAGTLFGLLNGEALPGAVRTGTLIALLTIESPATVSQTLDVAAVDALRARFAVRA